MKKTLILFLLAGLLSVGTIFAHKQPVPRMYMFGVAASFTDTIVHFTNIQPVDSAWIESKNGFLLERQAYAYQLRDHLAQKEQMPHRTCIVFYSQKLEKLEKKYQKMKQLYTKSKDGLSHFDVRNLDDQQFRFIPVSAEIDEETGTSQE